MDTTKQYCKGCQNNRTLDKFTEGLKTCDRCRAKQLRRYHKNPEYFHEKNKEWKQNNPEKVKEASARAREKASDKRYYCPLCEYDVQLCKKSQHEKGTCHQENVRKQTHPEEFENEDEPDSKYYDSEGRKFYSCTACRCNNIFPYQWRPHIRSEEHKHAKQLVKKKETFTNPNLLDTQYQLTECFLCCDE